MEKPKGIIIILHTAFDNVTEQDTLDALEPAQRNCHTVFLHLREDIPMQEAAHVHWEWYLARQTLWFQNEFKPCLAKYPGYRVLYFGLTHIPLAIHLGFTIGTFQKVDVYLRDYQTKEWKWADSTGKVPSLRYQLKGFPKEEIGGENDAVIRFSTYVKIAQADTREVVNDAAKEIDIQLDPTEQDAYVNRGLVEQAAEHFFDAIEALRNNMNLQVVHLFAAVPVGLAFLMGQKVNPNRHSLIYVYHFKQSESPKYRLAMMLQGEHGSRVLPSAENLVAVAALRKEIANDLKQAIKRFCNQASHHPQTWIPEKLDASGVPFFQNQFWQGLVPIGKTILRETVVKLTEIDQNSEIFYSEQEWNLPDYFLFQLFHSLKTEENARSALRLFMFHEAIHFKCHALSPALAAGIGRFPKILETIDYQADVYALLHEYQFQLENDGDIKPKKGFTAAIDLMLQTMWAFDAGGSSLSMQMRRINRYLIWYFQSLRIAHDSCKNVEDVMRILSIKPEIEIKGLKTVTDPLGRYIARFHGWKGEDLGIAVLYNNLVFQYGRSDVMPLDRLIEAFRDRESDRIRLILKALVDQILAHSPQPIR